MPRMQRLQAFKYELMPIGELQRQMRRFVFNQALAWPKERYARGEKNLACAGLRSDWELAGWLFPHSAMSRRTFANRLFKKSIRVNVKLRSLFACFIREILVTLIYIFDGVSPCFRNFSQRRNAWPWQSAKPSRTSALPLRCPARPLV